ncbi:MAG: iron-sulfur cluster carrier protein [bacterium]|nr:MAG: iron-sulfur cluster carrier protein [bacterium]
MKDKVLNALKGVLYPGFSRDIVSFGIIKNVEVRSGIAAIDAEITTDNSQIIETLKKSIPGAAKSVAGIIDVDLKFTVHKTSETGEVQNKNLAPNIKYIIATTSGKGGVGKSTISSNLAISLAKKYDVGLLDADIYGPNIPTMMGIEGHPITVNGDKKIVPIEVYNLKVVSIGNMVPQGKAIIWRGSLIHRAIQQLLGDVEWGKLDFLIVDLPPGTGDAQLTLAQSVPISASIIVTTPQEVAMGDAIKAIDMFKSLNVPIAGVIENMSYFLCPHCGERSDIFASNGGKKLSKKFDIPLLGEIPINLSIREGGDNGKPISTTDEDTIFDPIAEKLVKAVEEKNKRDI